MRRRGLRPVTGITLLAVLAWLSGCATLPPDSAPTHGQATTVESLLARAGAARERGDINGALTQYHAALGLAPGDVRALRGTGEMWLAVGRLDMAGAAFDDARKNAPADAGVLEGAGLVALRQGRQDEAARDLGQSVAIDPARWQAWNGLGVLADLRGEHDTALGHFDRALQVLPEHPELLNNRGYSLIMAGRHAQAEAALRAAVEHYPASASLRGNLALALARQGRYADAVEILIPTLGPARARNDIGYLAMIQGDREAAAGLFRAALAASPTYYELAADNLARVVREQPSK